MTPKPEGLIASLASQLLAVNFKDVQVYAPAALKEHVKIIDYGPQIRWFQILAGQAPVGCLGLLGYDDHTELKGVYVIPEMRGRGIGTQATEAAMALVEGPIEAAALNPAWYHARGFSTTGTTENGIAIVRKGFEVSSPASPQLEQLLAEWDREVHEHGLWTSGHSIAARIVALLRAEGAVSAAPPSLEKEK